MLSFFVVVCATQLAPASAWAPPHSASQGAAQLRRAPPHSASLGAAQLRRAPATSRRRVAPLQMAVWSDMKAVLEYQDFLAGRIAEDVDDQVSVIVGDTPLG